MNKQTLNATALAQNLLVYLFINTGIKDKVNNIYLFGSAVRGDLTKESDIDIFIDCRKKDEKEVEAIAKSALLRFYKSKDYEKWKLLRFAYPIAIQIGELATWHLKSSIASEGILLYSKTPIIESKERKVLFILKLPKEKNKYLKITRKLLGRMEKGYKEHGLLNDANGERLSTNVLIVPKENQQKIVEFLVKEKVEFRMKEVLIYE